MSRRLVALVIVALIAAELARPVHADVGADTDGNTMKAFVNDPGSANNVASGSDPQGPRCSWELAQIVTNSVDAELQANSGAGSQYRDVNTEAYVSAPGPNVETLYLVRCSDGSGGYRWAAPAQYIDRQALIDAAYDEAVASVPSPSIDISPPSDVGVPAQLGIWLAVDDPGQVNAFAQVGPVWASVTARFTGMTWDMGNGDVVECVGLGTPYPEGSNLLEQGPCGYTYTRVSDIGVRHVVVTGHWEVQLVTSDGVDQLLDPIDVTFEFDYEAYEIVTVVEA